MHYIIFIIINLFYSYFEFTPRIFNNARPTYLPSVGSFACLINWSEYSFENIPSLWYSLINGSRTSEFNSGCPWRLSMLTIKLIYCSNYQFNLPNNVNSTKYTFRYDIRVGKASRWIVMIVIFSNCLNWCCKILLLIENYLILESTHTQFWTSK